MCERAFTACADGHTHQEKTVEVLEKHGVRLVDRDEDGLARGGKLAQKAHDVVRTLAVCMSHSSSVRAICLGRKAELTETGSRLVKEEKQLRLRGELDTDGDALARLNVETEAREADHGVGLVFKLEKLDDLLDVGVLLRLRDVTGLTEVRREAERFAHGGRWFVNVELFDVCSCGKARSAHCPESPSSTLAFKYARDYIVRSERRERR